MTHLSKPIDLHNTVSPNVNYRLEPTETNTSYKMLMTRETVKGHIKALCTTFSILCKPWLF